MDQCEEEAALVTLEPNGSAQIARNLWPGLVPLKVPNHCKAPSYLKLMFLLAWWICSDEVLLTLQWQKPGLLTIVFADGFLKALLSQDKFAACCSTPVCTLPNHMALAMRLFLAGKPRGAQRGHPRAAVLPAFVSVGWADVMLPEIGLTAPAETMW